MEKKEFIERIVPLRDELLTAAQRMTGDTDCAEDLTQEVMLRLWNMHERLHEHPNVRALALTILHHKYYDEWRHRQQEQGSKIDEAAWAPAVPLIELRDQASLIRWIVEHLPPLQQQIFRMKEIEGYETEEIQEITGCTPESVRKNLSRARKRIREDYIRLTTRRKQR